jgi:hypothetical protein
MNRPSRGKPISVATITTNATASAPIQVADWDYADVTVVLAAGTGNATYRFQVSYTYGGTRIDLLEAGSATITKTAAGTFAHRLELGGAVELYVASIDLETSDPDYTLDATIYPFNRV